MEQKPLILVAVKGKIHKQIFGPAMPQIVGAEKKKLLASGNWKGWEIFIRTQTCYKAIPIINRKLKTFEEKIKEMK